jgi:glycosyltransferase 2 family protein
VSDPHRTPVPGPADPDLTGPDSADQLSLGRRLRQPRTIISLVVPLILIVLVFQTALGINFGQLVDGIRAANPLFLVAGFVVFYAGFPLRGYRWSLLLRGARCRIGARDATEILFLSWLVNCLVPAKLGDIYRAWLLKTNSTVSLSRTFGTVFFERILDLFAIAILGLAAGYWSFRNGLPPAIQVVFALGVGVVAVLAVALLTMRNFGRQILERLPLPRHRQLLGLYERFEEGVFGSIGVRALPRLFIITAAIWATEALRLYFVVRALNFPGVDLGLSGAVFVALIGSLLTAVPLSPAGLGVVEGGVMLVLVNAYNVVKTQAATIVVLDRLISVFSIIVLGGIVYAISPLRRGGRNVASEVEAGASA